MTRTKARSRAQIIIRTVAVAASLLAAGMCGALALAPEARPQGTAATVQTAAGTPAGLLPGETYVSIANGCGLIAPAYTGASADTIQKYLALLKSFGWSGECRYGLMHGTGDFSLRSAAMADIGMIGEYVYGRQVGPTTMTYKGTTTSTSYNLGNRSASLQTIDANATPFWSEDVFADSSVQYAEANADGTFNSTYIATIMGSCSLDKVAFPDCQYDDDNKYYGLTLNDGNTISYVWCPKPRTSAGCEALWHERIGPTMAKIRALQAEIAARDADIRAQAPARLAAWTTGWGQRKADDATQAIHAILARITGINLASADVAAAQRAYRAKLAKQNAGELFALADTLRRDGKNDQANEVLRTLVSRFPTSSLAGVAAGQLAGSPSGSGGGGSGGPAKYSSVCVRNLQKIEDDMVASNTRQAGGMNDLWLRDVNQMMAKLFEPCAGYDSHAASQRTRALNEDARIAQACAGGHSAVECLPWGYDDQALNQNYLNVLKGEWSRAMSDPNFSASLGSAAGPSGSGAVSATAGADEPAQRERCRVKLQDLGAAMRGDEAKIPKDGAVPRLKLLLWYTGEARAAIQQICPATAAYRDEANGYVTTAAQAQSDCDAISSTGRCTAARP